MDANSALLKKSGCLFPAAILFIVAFSLSACGDKTADSPNSSLPVLSTAFPSPSTVTSATGFSETAAGVNSPAVTVTLQLTPVETLNQPNSSPTALAFPSSASPSPTPSPLPPDTRMVSIKPTVPKVTTSTAAPLPTKAQSGSSQTGYIKGHVVAGPTCPVERADNPCPPRPVAGRSVQVMDQKQLTVLKTLTTDANGYFTVELAPGNYLLKLDSASRPLDRNGPYPVVIVAGKTSSLEILLDTGIR